MKKLTKKDLNTMMQDYDAWVVDVWITDTEFSERSTTKYRSFSTQDKVTVTYYDRSAKGCVTYVSAKYDIIINFNVIATAKGCSLADSYNFDLSIDTDSFDTSGFVLVDKAGESLSILSTKQVLANELNGREWGTDIKDLIPTLS